MEAAVQRWASYLLRIMSALLFLEHGTSKLLGWPSASMTPPFLSLLWVQGVIEVAGGVLLALGLLTRPVAFILSGDMAVAYFMSHAPKSFFPIINGGDGAILYCFVFLYLVAAGPGPLSVDAARGSKDGNPTLRPYRPMPSKTSHRRPARRCTAGRGRGSGLLDPDGPPASAARPPAGAGPAAGCNSRAPTSASSPGRPRACWSSPCPARAGTAPAARR